MSVVAFFPGQGSQHVGMGVALADAFSEAREGFQEVDDALSQKLSAMMRDGAESDLTLTENAQPALFAVSMAVVRVLEKQSGKPMGDLFSAAAGHSLGEYSALASMGALAIADGAKLLRLRGQAMQQAVPSGEGAMAALLGPELDAVTLPAPETTHAEAIDYLATIIAAAAVPGAMKHPSPLFGRLNHDQWTQLHCRHADLHFSFLQAGSN